MINKKYTYFELKNKTEVSNNKKIENLRLNLESQKTELIKLILQIGLKMV